MRRIAIIAFLALVGCTSSSVEKGSNTDNNTNNTNNGPADCDAELVELPSGETACLFQQAIVIETGFLCPTAFSNRFDFQTFTACDRRVSLPRIDLDFLNLRDLRQWPELPFDAAELPDQPIEASAVDILWVIDNSGSMCQEQTQLRSGIREFIQGLGNVDFHIGVTTTHMNPNYVLEPLAQPGVLQSSPQPVPGFDQSCVNAVDENGAIIADDFSPIRNALAVAVSCMETPDESFNSITDDEIRCALNGTPAGCEIVSRGCGGANNACAPQDLFPAPESYRALPKVLQRSNYMTGDQLDLAALEQDFSCMSLVGTRGYGVEAGLAAASLAVSPALTGTGAENEGFLREDARFALFFVTDENDCSDDGTLDVTSSCGGDICEYAAALPEGESPLLQIRTLRNDLLDNLSQSKGRIVDPREVAVSSFHGQSRPYEGPVPTEQECTNGTAPEIVPTCATSLGIAYSGDRYEKFLRSFPHGNQFPYAANVNEQIDGWVCNGGFVSELAQAGGFLESLVTER